MPPSWAPAGSDDSDRNAGPELDDRPGLGGVSETQRREQIVSLVDARPHTPYTVGELTVALAEWFESETEGMVPTDEEIHSVLFDFDLPRLDESNRLVFERQTGRVFSTDASDALVSSSVREATSDDAPTHADSETSGASAIGATEESGQAVPAERVVELGILLIGVTGVALTASNVAPFDTTTTLVPAVAVVLFFGYRTLTRW